MRFFFSQRGKRIRFFFLLCKVKISPHSNSVFLIQNRESHAEYLMEDSRGRKAGRLCWEKKKKTKTCRKFLIRREMRQVKRDSKLSRPKKKIPFLQFCRHKVPSRDWFWFRSLLSYELSGGWKCNCQSSLSRKGRFFQRVAVQTKKLYASTMTRNPLYNIELRMSSWWKVHPLLFEFRLLNEGQKARSNPFKISELQNPSFAISKQ